MLSKRLYVNILTRVLLIMLLSLLAGYLIFRGLVWFSIICSALILITTIDLISYFNRTNRTIRYFFDSIKNEDSNLSFSMDESNEEVKELHISMNRVNRMVQDLKLENRLQEQSFRKILELLGTAIITYDRKGFIHHANSAAKKLLAVDSLTHIGQFERVDKRLFFTVSNIKPNEKHLVAVKTKQGEINLLLKSTSSGSDGDELNILTIQDIKNELDEKELDAWMKLIRVLMHEIMNSITPITSLSESLQKIFRTESRLVTHGELSDSNIEVASRGLEAIREQGKGLMYFTESVRKLSNLPKPEMKNFPVSHLFSRVDVLAERFERGANIHISFSDNFSDYEIFADENLISQVLINLIKNAIEANELNRDCEIRISASTSDDNTPEISVYDNGPGIPEENIENIFMPFFTTRKNGSGIGLSLSRQIMRMHGGSLTVSSRPGNTVFCMRFNGML